MPANPDRPRCTATVHRCRGCAKNVTLRCDGVCPRCSGTDIDPASPCRLPPVTGATVCWMHGGKAQQVKTAGKARVAVAKAVQAVATYGLPRNIDPHQALIEEIARTAGAIDWLHGIIAVLNQEAVTWGLSGTERGFNDKGTVEMASESSGVNVWVQLYQHERRHLVDVCKTAIGCGIAERQVQLAEQQGQLIAEVFRAVFADPELGLAPGQQEVGRRVVARHLRALPAA